MRDLNPLLLHHARRTSFGLDHLIVLIEEENEWERILSGGEKQKVAIIRSIVNKPDILFLDESFSAMDKESEELSINILNKELAEATIVLISHKNKVSLNLAKVINKKNLSLHIE